VRTGGPKEEPEDYALPVWAGIVPLSLVPGEPYDDGRVVDGVSVPESARNYGRANNNK
jgi:hypothetical protein